MQLDTTANSHVGGYARHQICIQAISIKACAERESSTMIMVRQAGTGRLVAAASLAFTSIWLADSEVAIHMERFVPSRSNCGEDALCL